MWYTKMTVMKFSTFSQVNVISHLALFLRKTVYFDFTKLEPCLTKTLGTISEIGQDLPESL